MSPLGGREPEDRPSHPPVAAWLLMLGVVVLVVVLAWTSM